MSMTDPHLPSSKAVGGQGKPQANSQPVAGDAALGKLSPVAGWDGQVGTSRPAGQGNAGGGPGNGAKGSGVAAAQSKVVGSGPVNVGASGEGHSKVGMEPVKRQTGAKLDGGSVGAESNTLPGFPGGTYD